MLISEAEFSYPTVNCIIANMCNLDYIVQMRIWGDSSRSPLLSIMPHGGEAVAAVAFLSAPRRPDHHVLLTAVCLIISFSLLFNLISEIATIK